MLFGIAFFGAGCPSTNTTHQLSAVLGRMHEDLPTKCDIHSPAAPPCTYQTTLDGLLTTYVQGVGSSADTSTMRVVVHSINGKDEVVYSMPRGPGSVVYRTVGISDDGRFVYLHENVFGKGAVPYINQSSLDKIDTQTHALTKILTFEGSPLDVYAHKNLMVLWIFEMQTKTEKAILTDLQGKALRTLYQGTFSNFDESAVKTVGDIRKAYKKANIVLFSKAVISPDGSKVLLESLNGDLWPEFTLFDVNTGEKTVLDKIDQNLWQVTGWKDNETLLLKGLNTTSTFSIKNDSEAKEK